MWHKKKVGKVSDFRKIMICFKIVTFKRFGRKIVKFKQIIFKIGKIVTFKSFWANHLLQSSYV